MIRLIFAIMGIASIANAYENCLKLIYNETLIQRDSILLDSVYFLEGINDWSHKYYNTEGALDSLRFDKLDGSSIVTLKFLNNETELSSIGDEVVLFKSIRNDTIVEILNDYSDGQLSVSRKTVWTKDTVEYTETSSGEYRYKMYMNLDTLTQIYFEDSEPTDTTYFVESGPGRCVEYDSKLNEAGQIEYTFNEEGYVEKYTDGDYSRTAIYKYPKYNVGIFLPLKKNKIFKSKKLFDLIGRINR